MQYTQDYDERMVPLWNGTYTNAGNVLFNQLVQPYVKSMQIFTCPSDSSVGAAGNSNGTTWANPNPGGGMLPPFHTSYIANYNQGSGNGASLASVQNSATTIYLADGGVRANTAAPWVTSASAAKPASWLLYYPNDGNVNGTNGDWAGPSIRHLDMSVVGFYDGHVKAMKVEKWYYPASPWLDLAAGGS